MKLWQYARGGERMKATRSYFGLSGNETAKQMGIKSGTYSSYERQIAEPSVETLEKFCDQVLWINDGHFVMLGDTSTVLAEYNKSMQL